jgi:hypothetical protein
MAVFLYSLLLYGWWLPGWLNHTLNQSVGPTTFFDGGLGAFPWGLLAWLPLIVGYRYYQQKEAAAAIISATILSVPYAGEYGVMVYLGLPLAWFSYLFALPLEFVMDMRLILVILVLQPFLKRLWQARPPAFRRQ